MNTPLYDKLLEYSSSKLAFHMPGHKFGSAAKLNEISIIELDNTEAMGMDNLYDAQGIIKEAMQLMADFYKSKETLFLTNGSTSGIIASILSVCKPGDELIVARNAHHSVWSALVLGGITPIYINPKYVEDDNILGEIKPDIVEMALRQYPKAKGVVVVSPTYEGIVSDIQSISTIVHKYNKLLIVDEAHGAHFILSDNFPLTSIVQGADLVINSMHKTLPALTQSGLLHICSNRVKYESVIEALRMIQTSSPSYIMMGLMDYIRCYILEHHMLIKRQYIDELIMMRARLHSGFKVLRLIERAPEFYDRSKIIISTAYANINGYELSDLLNKHFSIVVEAALDNYIILMTTMADQKATLEKLERALLIIDSNLYHMPKRISINTFMLQSIAIGETPRKIFYSKKVWKVSTECQGKYAVKNIMLYPPGIPLVCVGEMIEERHINLIHRVKDKLQGIQIINNQVYLEVSE